jgi:hypothetical protein
MTSLSILQPTEGASRVNKYTLGLALMLGLALVATQTRADDDDADAKKARADVLDVVKDIEAGKDVTKKVDALRKKYEDLENIMKVFKPRDAGGVGIGPKVEKADGIEFKIINLGKEALPPAKLAKEKGELLKMAYLNVAMAKITHKFVGTKKPALWKKYSQDMEKHSKELLEELKKAAPNPGNIKKIAFNLSASCSKCHSDIRDD